MDYSTLPHDPEHPAGSSPWASSPQHNRTSFSQSQSSEVPPSPLPPAHSPYSGRHTREQGSLDSGDGSAAEDTIVESTSANGTTLASENTFPPAGDAQHVEQQQYTEPQQSPHQQQYQDPPEGPRPEPQRYRHPKPSVRQVIPHGKLQAKITGLERTGRKDTILRFDVYVCSVACRFLWSQTANRNLLLDRFT